MSAQAATAPGLFYAPYSSVAPPAGVEGGDDPGLVAVAAWGPRFASAALVRASAALLPAQAPRVPGKAPEQLLAHAEAEYGAWRRDPQRSERHFRCSCRGCTNTEPEGPTWRITVAPGALSVGTKDYARAERTAERQSEAVRRDVDMVVAQVLDNDGEWPERPPSRGEISEWSRKSRARMVRTLCELDYDPLYRDAEGNLTGRVPAMVTLTYPGDWRTVAPTGRAAKRHLDRFFRRYERAWGEPLAVIWKLEFQRRGAPHFHLLMSPPQGRAADLTKPDGTSVVGAGMAFRQWLSHVWADIVDHPDPQERARHLAAGTGVDFAEGLRASDPKRVAVYFLKHNVAGDKEYQHVVPEQWKQPGDGPGRFWGTRGLSKAVATVEVTPQDATAAARVMRRWSRAQGRTKQVTKMRVEQSTGRVYYRKTRTRTTLLGRGRGWIAVNDGPGFASDLARYLSQRARWDQAEEMAESRQQRRAREREQAKHPEQRERVYEVELSCEDIEEILTPGEELEEGEERYVWYGEGGWQNSSVGGYFGDFPQLHSLVDEVLTEVRRSRWPGRVRLVWKLDDRSDARPLAREHGIELPEWA